MTNNLNQMTPEQIDKSYSAAMDSVDLINGDKPVDMSDADWSATVARNVEHLEIMVAKDYWTTAHDLQPMHDAIAKG